MAETTVAVRRFPTQEAAHPILRVAFYARVSTSNGHQDPEMQLAELREYASRRGWQIAAEYVDRRIRFEGITSFAEPAHGGRTSQNV